ncbi:MAG TPA: response regulator transcription factor [Actinomycetota bacterium]|nr:response regulator transcription factor [Actinomycetota bacterium]
MNIVEQVASGEGQTPARARVMLADDHTLVRQSVAKIVASEMEFSVVGEAARGDDAVALAARVLPDIVLLDVGLPGMTGLEAAQAIRAHAPAVRVIFLTMHEDDATVSQAIALGADGYLLKTASTEELLNALRAVAAGGSFLSPSVARNVMRRASSKESGTLTQRELEILRLLALGERPADVAKQLYVSLKTVRNHLASIYVKLNVGSAAQAVSEAFRRGLVSRTL